MCHIITGGTALPIALYCLDSETVEKTKLSGKDWILAASLGVKRRYLPFTNNTGSVELRLTFAKCELMVLH